MRSNYKIGNYERANENARLRNFEPQTYNRNHSEMVNLVDETNKYWLQKQAAKAGEQV